LALITSRFPYGPTESFLREEIAELRKRFDVSIVAALPGDEPICDDSLRDRSERMKIFAWPVLVSAFAEMCRAPLATARVFITVVKSPRGLNAKIKNALIFPKALAVSRFARERSIAHIHAYWLSIPATIAYVVHALNGIPWSTTGHRWDLVDFNITSLGRANGGFISTARFVRTISRRGHAQARRALCAHDTPVVTEHLGVRIPLRAAGVVPGARLRMLCAASLEPVKGHSTLLSALQRAVSANVPVVCTLAGSGSETERLHALVRELGLEKHVIFEGALAHDVLLARMQEGAYDAAILTSVDEGPNLCEGIPVFLMESMAAGLPVIATSSGAVGELVNPENGLLCTPGDVAGISRAIAALANSPALRAQLGAGARETVNRGFDVTKTAARVAALMIPRKGRARARIDNVPEALTAR
jgi:glycosyltransferase involved in cell wall biosynthesis